MSDNFYEPPSSKPNPTAPKYSFFDTRGIAKVISFLFYGTAVFSLIGLWVSSSRIDELQQFGFSETGLTQAQSIEQGLTFFEGIISIALIFNYLIWISKSYKNLYPLNATGLKHSPSWAVGFWFIPFINLVKPFQVVLEIFRASSLSYPDEPNNQWQALPVKPYLYWWWFIYIGNGVIGGAAAVRAVNSNSADQALLLTQFYEISMFVDFAMVIACFLAAKVVLEISDMQYQRYCRIRSETDLFIA